MDDDSIKIYLTLVAVRRRMVPFQLCGLDRKPPTEDEVVLPRLQGQAEKMTELTITSSLSG